MIVARSQYDERPVFASDLDFKDDPGVTKQSDSKDADINLLFKRYEKTGQLPNLILRDGSYGDFSDAPTLEEAFQIVRKAEEQFSNLDAPIRNRFENNPVKFAEFVTNPDNIDEVERLGLLKPEAVEARNKARNEKDQAYLKAEAEKAKIAEDAFIQKVAKAVKAL